MTGVMKRLFAAAAAVVTATLCGAEILPNPAWEKNCAGWTRRFASDATLTVRDAVAECSAGSKRSFLIRYKLPAAPGNYVGSYQVCGVGGYRVYCEYHDGTAGRKRFYRTSGAAVLEAPAEWETRRFEFPISPKDAERIRSFAFVISVEPGAKVRFKAPSLQYAPAKETRLASPIGGRWIPSDGGELSGDGKSQELRQSGRARSRPSRLCGIPVTPGKTYRFTCRTQGIATADSGGFCAFRIVPAGGGRELLAPVWDDTLRGERQFKHLTFTVPEGIGELELRFETPEKTEVGFSEFSLTETEKPVAAGTLLLTEPACRDQVLSTAPVRRIAGRVIPGEGETRAEVRLSAAGMETVKAVPEKDGTFAFASPGRDCAVTADFFDAAGRKSSTSTREVKFPPPHPTEVTFDNRNFMLVNGRRFFPVVFWELTAVNEPDGLYYAARRGVNCIMLPDRYARSVEAKRRILDAAHRYGVKVFLILPSVDDLTDDRVDEYRRTIGEKLPPELREHPACIGYFLTDEPIWRGVPRQRVLNGYRVIRALDPYRPVWINAAPRNPVEVHARYAEAADIYGIDIYPYPYPNSQSGMADKGLTCVGKYTEFCREAVRDAKPVWMALQGFSWHSYTNLDDGRGYPGLNHMRFVWYETLLHGGRAGSIWGTRHIRSEAFYDTLFDLTAEMHRVSGLFLDGGERTAVKSSDPAVIAETLACAGERYLIVRNTGEKPAISLLTGDFPAMRRLIPAGNRMLDAGRAQVALEGFEVAIYGTAELPPPAYELPPADPELDRRRSPFRRVTKADLAGRRYEGKANWIWAPAAFVPNGKAELTRKLPLDPAKIRKVEIRFAADDSGTLWFNGRKLLSCGHFSRMVRAEVPAGWLRGENTVVIRAEDSGTLPCGALAEIRVTATDGTTETTVTDEAWTCAGGAAKIIAPFGRGAWGKRVMVTEEK